MAEQKKVSIVYEKNKSHVTAPITGIWGGLSPDRSHINASFFLDQVVIPNYQTVDVESDGGKLNFKQVDNVSRGDLVREIFATLTFSPSTARAIARWLVERADELESK